MPFLMDAEEWVKVPSKELVGYMLAKVTQVV